MSCGWRQQLYLEVMEFSCPKCGTILFSHQENAKNFLWGPSKYRCSRCNRQVNEVFYQVYPKGDLCRECHEDLKCINMECRVTDNGTVHFVEYYKMLDHLWQIKVNTGKPITQQVSEAIKEYISRWFKSVKNVEEGCEDGRIHLQ